MSTKTQIEGNNSVRDCCETIVDSSDIQINIGNCNEQNYYKESESSDVKQHQVKRQKTNHHHHYSNHKIVDDEQQQQYCDDKTETFDEFREINAAAHSYNHNRYDQKQNIKNSANENAFDNNVVGNEDQQNQKDIVGIGVSKTNNNNKSDKSGNRGGGGGGGGNCNNHKFNFRAPPQFGQNNNKKMWNKFKSRQKIQYQINKADMENIQNLKNQANNRKQQLHVQLQQQQQQLQQQQQQQQQQQPQQHNNLKNPKLNYNKKMLAHHRSGGGGGGGNGVGGGNGGGGGGGGVLGGGVGGGVRSKFFLPDKRPRKEIIIPPTKFLLGGNISDPLNLNSLQDEALNSSTTPNQTPKQSPITTPPKVEVIIPPNIHDPLHLLDPVDSIEYEKQLVSPMKRKSKSKHRHRKKKPKKRKHVGGNKIGAGCVIATISSSNVSSLISATAISSSQAQPLVTNPSDFVNSSVVTMCSTSASSSAKMTTVISNSATGFDDGTPSNESGSTNCDIIGFRMVGNTELVGGGDLSTTQVDDMEKCLDESKNNNNLSFGSATSGGGGVDIGEALTLAQKENEESTTSKPNNMREPRFYHASAPFPSECPSTYSSGTMEGSLLGRRSLDREKAARELRLELGGIEQQGSGRKRRISEGPNNMKSKFRRMDSMDKIVSPVVPQPGAWKRPPRTVPTGARKTSRLRSTSVSETELISPTDDVKIGESESIRDDTPDLDIQQKQQRDEPQIRSGAQSPNQRQQQQQRMPKFKPEGVKYQYGNYDRYSGFRNLNQFMDVRLQVFHQHSHLFRNKDVLDIGCNVGHMTIAVAKTLTPKSILGIDIDGNLISRARRNLSFYVRIPNESNVNQITMKSPIKNTGIVEDNKDDVDVDVEKSENKKSECHNKTDDTKNSQVLPENSKQQFRKNSNQRRKSYQKHKAIKEKNCTFFPISFPICYGGIRDIPSTSTNSKSDSSPQPKEPNVENQFPSNVFFRKTNYVLKDESLLNNDTQQYDIIMCLSVTKWIHLNFGDAGLKLAFKRMFNQLRPGGKLILEAQNWASYKKKKNLTETIYKNYRSIEFFPNKFHEYLLGNDVGFSHSYVLGVPRHLSKGFCRPIQLYAKGDYTPNHIRWSDNYHPQTPYEAYRGIYAGMPRQPSYPLWGYDTPHGNSGSYSCRQTPLHPGLSTSQYYNPLETDSYLPSYDTEVQNRHYVFASPLYQTVWSPPASLKNSSSHTPAFGSVRESDMEDGVENLRHVYPPTDCGSSPQTLSGGAFSSIREVDTDDGNQNHLHVYANCDSSSSPKVDYVETSPTTNQFSRNHQQNQQQSVVDSAETVVAVECAAGPDSTVSLETDYLHSSRLKVQMISNLQNSRICYTCCRQTVGAKGIEKN